MNPRAAGFLIFRKKISKIEFLFMKASYGQKHWTPPKGHVDPGEDDMTTALRETKEEAGLDKSDLKIMEKTWELSYPVKDWKDGVVRQKTTIYFLAELISDKEVLLSEEHTEISWADATDSKLLIPAFLDLQKMLDETIQLINNI